MSQPVKQIKTEIFFPTDDSAVQFFEDLEKREQFPPPDHKFSKALKVELVQQMVKRLQKKERERQGQGE